MFSSLPMVLIADRDSFSNSTLSYGLRKLCLARNVICTKSASSALAYLQKQQICSYPFPEYIMLNPSSSNVDVADFIKSFNVKFSDHYDSKFILLRDKHSVSEVNSIEDDQIIGNLRKPISTEHLLQLFKGRAKNAIHS